MPNDSSMSKSAQTGFRSNVRRMTPVVTPIQHPAIMNKSSKDYRIPFFSTRAYYSGPSSLPQVSPSVRHATRSPQPAPRPAYSPRQLDILLHDRDSLGVYGAQICVLEKMDQEGFGALLQRLDGLRLPAHTVCAHGDEVECDFSDLGERGRC